MEDMFEERELPTGIITSFARFSPLYIYSPNIFRRVFCSFGLTRRFSFQSVDFCMGNVKVGFGRTWSFSKFYQLTTSTNWRAAHQLTTRNSRDANGKKDSESFSELYQLATFT
jgi:hypothetical protein